MERPHSRATTAPFNFRCSYTFAAPDIVERWDFEWYLFLENDRFRKGLSLRYSPSSSRKPDTAITIVGSFSMNKSSWPSTCIQQNQEFSCFGCALKLVFSRSHKTGVVRCVLSTAGKRERAAKDGRMNWRRRTNGLGTEGRHPVSCSRNGLLIRHVKNKSILTNAASNCWCGEGWVSERELSDAKNAYDSSRIFPSSCVET